VGDAAARQQRYDRPAGATGGPLAVLPLATADGLVGVLVLHELLSQKAQLVATDDELFTLLATHATTALAAALLREQSPPALRVLDVAVARALLA
jgi:GAF domain-containing protein